MQIKQAQPGATCLFFSQRLFFLILYLYFFVIRKENSWFEGSRCTSASSIVGSDSEPDKRQAVRDPSSSFAEGAKFDGVTIASMHMVHGDRKALPEQVFECNCASRRWNG